MRFKLARLTLCVLRPLRRFMLNLAKLCKANFAHKSVGELTLQAYFARLLCMVEMLLRLLCIACFVYVSMFIFLLAGFKGQRCKAYFARFNSWRAYFARLTLRG
jgi:hypothetical protein